MSGTPPATGYGAAGGPFGPAASTSDALFRQIYEHAKLNDNWPKVASALKAHPDWLLKIPEGRRWTILHQIVFSGNPKHLDEALSYQINNPDFRLLFKARDEKTVRDVATERAHVHPQMIRHIERYVFCDMLLNNAQEEKWSAVKHSIQQKPDLVNEKPPYRREYLVHHLAAKGRLKEFKELNEIVQLKLDVLADGKTPSQLARDNGHQEFADYLDTLPPPGATGGADSTTGDAAPSFSSPGDASSSSAAGPHSSGHSKYSPGFYDDISISIMPVGGTFTTLTGIGYHGPDYHSHSLHGPPLSHSAHSAHTGSSPIHHSGWGASGYGGGASGGGGGSAYHGKSGAKKPSLAATKSTLSEDEQTKYEKTISANAAKVTGSQLLDSMTCPITKQLLRDPVLAADGFTYEREAILKWFETSSRSPMTNKELENLELKPNHSIRSILETLQNSGASSKDPAKGTGSGKKAN